MLLVFATALLSDSGPRKLAGITAKCYPNGP